MDDGPTILWVDAGTEDLATAADRLRERTGAATVATETGVASALARLEEPVDCVVAGYQFPDGDAPDLLGSIRELDRRVPVVLYARIPDDAATRALEVGATAFLPKDGAGIPVLAAQVRSVLDRHRTRRETERRYRNLVEESPDPILVVQDGEIAYANDATAALVGVESPRDLEGRDPLELVHPDDAERFDRHLRRVLEGQRVECHLARIRTDRGRARHVEVRPSPVNYDGRPAAQVVVRDVTEQRLSQQRLAVLNRVLRHNIRNEVGVIEGHAELIAARTDDDVDEHVEVIRETAQGLVELSAKARRVQTALDRALEDPRAIAVGELLEQVQTNVLEQYPAATVTVDAGPESVIVDASLGDAIQELVENAVEHTDDRTVRLSATVHDQRVEVEVRDRGPGIPEIERATLTEGDERPLQHGDGLGLWLVYWLARILGGDVEFDPEAGEGATVRVSVPVLQ